jgi:hypothetical protein
MKPEAEREKKISERIWVDAFEPQQTQEEGALDEVQSKFGY